MKRKILQLQLLMVIAAITIVYFTWFPPTFHVKIIPQFKEPLANEWTVWVGKNKHSMIRTLNMTTDELRKGIDLRIPLREHNYQIFIRPNLGRFQQVATINSGAFSAQKNDQIVYDIPIQFFFYKNRPYQQRYYAKDYHINLWQYISYSRSFVQQEVLGNLNFYEGSIRKNGSSNEPIDAIYIAQIIAKKDTIYRLIKQENAIRDDDGFWIVKDDAAILEGTPVVQPDMTPKGVVIEVDKDTWWLGNIVLPIDIAEPCPYGWRLPYQTELERLLSNLGYFRAHENANFWQYTQKNWDYLGLAKEKPTHYRLYEEEFYLSAYQGAVKLSSYSDTITTFTCQCIRKNNN